MFCKVKIKCTVLVGSSVGPGIRLATCVTELVSGRRTESTYYQYRLSVLYFLYWPLTSYYTIKYLSLSVLSFSLRSRDLHPVHIPLPGNFSRFPHRIGKDRENGLNFCVFKIHGEKENGPTEFRVMNWDAGENKSNRVRKSSHKTAKVRR